MTHYHNDDDSRLLPDGPQCLICLYTKLAALEARIASLTTMPGDDKLNRAIEIVNWHRNCDDDCDYSCYNEAVLILTALTATRAELKTALKGPKIAEWLALQDRAEKLQAELAEAQADSIDNVRKAKINWDRAESAEKALAEARASREAADGAFLLAERILSRKLEDARIENAALRSRIAEMEKKA